MRTQKREGRQILRSALVALSAVLLIGCMVFLCACQQSKDEGTQGDNQGQQEQKEQGEEQSTTFVFTDSAGRQVTIPTNVTRVAVSGPVAQMFMLSFDSSKLVGLATSLSDEQIKYFGTAVSELPIYGQIYGGKGTMDKESLAAANPQLILDIGEAKDSIVEDMDELQNTLGIPCVHIDATLATYDTTFTMLGTLLSMTDRGSEMATYCKNAYDSVVACMNKHAEGSRVSALYLVSNDSLGVMAKGSYQSGVIDMILDNVAVVDNPSSKGTGNMTDIEQVALWDAEYLIVGTSDLYDAMQTEAAWQGVNAVKNGKVLYAPQNPYCWMNQPPSINQLIGIQWLSHVFYPEDFTDSVKDVVKGYYQMFYGYTLSDTEYNALMADSLIK